MCGCDGALRREHPGRTAGRYMRVGWCKLDSSQSPELSKPAVRPCDGVRTASTLIQNLPPSGKLTGRFREVGFSSSGRSVGGYLRAALIWRPRKSHRRRYLQRSVSTRIDNLPELEAGMRDFTLAPQCPGESLVFPRIAEDRVHRRQESRGSRIARFSIALAPVTIAPTLTRTGPSCRRPGRDRFQRRSPCAPWYVDCD